MAELVSSIDWWTISFASCVMLHALEKATGQSMKPLGKCNNATATMYKRNRVEVSTG